MNVHMWRLIGAVCLMLFGSCVGYPVQAHVPADSFQRLVSRPLPGDAPSFTAIALATIEAPMEFDEALWLGFVADGNNVFGLLWAHDADDWFGRWSLSLVDYDDDSDGADEGLPLAYMTPTAGSSYEIMLAYDTAMGAVGYRLRDIATGAHVNGVIPHSATVAATHAYGGVFGQAPLRIDQLHVAGTLYPIGMSFRLLQRDVETDEWGTRRYIDRRGETAWELHVPWGHLDGVARLTATAGGNILGQFDATTVEDGIRLPLPVRDWPSGDVSLSLDYITEGETVAIHETNSSVGTITVEIDQLQPITTDQHQTFWSGVLRLRADGPVRDVRARLAVRRTDYVPDVAQGGVVSLTEVVDARIRFDNDTLIHDVPFSFTMVTPDHPWSLALEPTVETDVHVLGPLQRSVQELYYGLAPEEPLPVKQDRLRLALYNIRYGLGMDGDVNLSRIAQLLLDHDVDVVVFNEVDYGWPRSDGVDQPKVLSELLGMPYVYYMPTVQRFSPKLEGHGHAVMSRVPLQSTMGHYLPRLGVREYRGAIGTTIPIGRGETVQLWGTHLAHGGTSIDAEQRLVQVEHLLRLVGDKELAIVTGDLNAVPAEPAIRFLLDAGWVDVWARLGTGMGNTFPSDYPDRRIDYVFASPALADAFVSIEVPRTLASDHLPIIAEIDLTRLH